MNWEKAFKEISRLNWIILLILGTGSFFLMKPDFTLGIILGGLLIIVNFNMLQHTICGAFRPDGAPRIKKHSIILKYYLRLAIVGIIIYILITRFRVAPVGLTIGLSTVVISILNFGIRAFLKSSSERTI